MYHYYDQNAPKKPTNLSINSDLLKKSKMLKVNLSATLEQALKNILAQKQEQQWRDENKNAIQAYNDFIEENGVFGDEFRSF
ncbi:MAG: acetoacetyl-CoA synthase [Gammaproteobacteria bacterium]|nr:acetoacetyl-CoA synthase [Gammaproteobacteria bacterium]